MNIEKIIIRNLTSLEGEHIIDFTEEPLRSAGLFAITGNTGSGKSTILDAICLSLYGRAPRFEGIEGIKSDKLVEGPDGEKSIQAKDPRGLLRRGQTEGGCTIVFSKPDGSRYEASWSVRLKRTGTYERAAQTLRQLSPRNIEIPTNEVQQRVRDIVGLDYEQFTRTILLAQNSFAGFLRARHDEKSTLLEKLTGTEIYGKLSIKIFEKTRAAESIVKEYATQEETLMLSHLTPEQQSEAEAEKKQLELNIQEANRRLENIAKQIEWLDNYQAATRECERLERERDDADRTRMSRTADEHALKLYDLIQPIAPVWQRIQSLRSAAERLRKEEEELGRKLILATQQLEDAARFNKQATEKREEAQRTLQSRQNDIEKGFLLTGEINTSKQSVERAAQTATETAREQQGKHDSVEAHKKRLVEQEKEVSKDKYHQQTLAVHSNMFDNFSIVKDRLTEFKGEADINEEVHRLLVEKQMRLKDLSLSLERLNQRGFDINTRMQALKSTLDVHRQGVKGIDGAELQKKAANISSQLQQLTRADKLWRRIAESYELINERHNKVVRDEVDIEQLRHKISISRVEENNLVEENERHYKSYTLSQSQDILSLRKNLEEGSPCPLCGATHHPYHTETERALGELISNLRYEWQDSNARLSRHREALRALELELQRLETQHLSDTEYLDERRRMLQDDIEEWKSYAALDGSFADSSSTVNHHARITHISLLIDRTKRERDELERNLREYTRHQNQISQISEEIASLTDEINQDKEKQANTKQEMARMEGKIENLQERVERSDKRYRLLYQDLDAYISLTSWLDEWKKSPEDFRTRLSGMEADWRRVSGAIDKGEARLAAMRTELEQLQIAEAEAKRIAVEASDNLRNQQEQLQAKEAEFERIFGESDPATLQLQLQNNIEVARSNEEKAILAWRNASDEVTELRGKKMRLLEQREADTEEYQAKTSELDRWILLFNREHTPIQTTEINHLLGSGRDFISLRKELQILRDTQKAAHQRVEAASKLLKDMHDLPTKPRIEGDAGRDILHNEADEVSLNLATLKEQHINVSARLIAHHETSERLGELSQQMDKARTDYDWWNRLSKVFGSADGKRFRELAQQYTFASLVARANTQLAHFSPRYQLSMLPGTLMLEVIDRDMFDRRRYANSLSGGETFVVSLALALALSSLSGAGLPLGSLFIDEGFGNLDRQSLDLVMTALSNLESAGKRKVGIISHTEQIRNGITPQIHLINHQATGSSSLRIE
ncbi:MAG: AAA family ATPase [Bacteroidaceae bacterium]|nr:AAA family ATPase [Bacteroidaceae bacterium]